MRTVVITIGLPGSGKSTWARQQMAQEPFRWKRVNKDDLRAMIDGPLWNKENEQFINDVQERLVKSALTQECDVIIDNTHLVARTRKRLHEICEGHGDVKVIERMFQVSLDDCLKRNAARPAPVPEHVITGMHEKHGNMIRRGPPVKEFYYVPKEQKTLPVDIGEKILEQSVDLPKAILCDLDGTLAKMGKRSPFDASKCDVVDAPNWPVIECVKAMHAQGVKIIFMSGREDKDREPSIRFIERFVRVPSNWAFPKENDDRPETSPVPYELHMRPSKDMRKDAIIKRELFDAHVRGKFNVLFVLDDRNQVVDNWRDMGLTCFQVAPGNF